MELRLKINPIKSIGRTKWDAMTFIRNRGMWNYPDGVTVDNERKNYILYSAQKINKKTKQTKYKSGKREGQTAKSEIIRKKQWIVSAYIIPIEVAKLMNVKFSQFNMHFTMTKLK